MSEQRYTDRQLQEFAEEHLAHEVHMLTATARELAAGADHPPHIADALLESFAIHLRALIGFLWEPATGPSNSVAGHYCASLEQWQDVMPEYPAVLMDAWDRTGQNLAHLNYVRLTVSPVNKEWPFVKMANSVVDALSVFKAHALPARLGSALADLPRAQAG